MYLKFKLVLKSTFFILIIIAYIYTLLMLFLYSPSLDGLPGDFGNYIVRTVLGMILLYIITSHIFSRVLIIFSIITLLSPGLIFFLARRVTDVYNLQPISAIDIRNYDNPDWNVTWVPSSNASDNASTLIVSDTISIYSAAKIEFPAAGILEQAWWQRPLRSVPKLSIDIQIAMNYQRTGAYFTLITVDGFTIQSVNNGLLFTAPRPDHDVKADFINLNKIPDQFSRPWRLLLQNNNISVYLDNKEVWRSDVNIVLRDLVLGDMQNTPDHGGVFAIENAVFKAKLLYVQ